MLGAFLLFFFDRLQKVDELQSINFGTIAPHVQTNIKLEEVFSLPPIVMLFVTFWWNFMVAA